MGDDLIINEVPGVQQLVDVARAENKPVIGVMEVPPHKVDKYGTLPEGSAVTAYMKLPI